jgi:hypothetical protein
MKLTSVEHDAGAAPKKSGQKLLRNVSPWHRDQYDKSDKRPVRLRPLDSLRKLGDRMQTATWHRLGPAKNSAIRRFGKYNSAT